MELASSAKKSATFATTALPARIRGCYATAEFALHPRIRLPCNCGIFGGSGAQWAGRSVSEELYYIPFALCKLIDLRHLFTGNAEVQQRGISSDQGPALTRVDFAVDLSSHSPEVTFLRPLTILTRCASVLWYMP